MRKVNSIILCAILVFFPMLTNGDFVKASSTNFTTLPNVIEEDIIKEPEKKENNLSLPSPSHPKVQEMNRESETIVLKYATIYRPEVSQCDGNPLITADGSIIDMDKLNADSLKWIAVSQDMLKRNGGIFKYGDTIYLDIPGNPAFTGTYIVHDCMNKRYKKSVDILTGYNKKGFMCKDKAVIRKQNN